MPSRPRVRSRGRWAGGGYVGDEPAAKGLGFAYVPLGFAAVVAAVALPLGPAAAVILPVAFLGATLWSFVLDVAIREVHRLSTGRAVGAVVLPIAVGFGLLVLLFGALLAALFAAG